ncbi:patatin-like phospholipase family protein [Acinetobacter nectaris]|uniref:patatin-like phospholipase family protein n=1 Tax=Acinetobacter nectaris TaxID=1219382 RepID=UPI001F225D65|nr:patatin-like phospholipase family protein [Acinetobacter nectaris]MCF8999532.1 patatin-like phospholipase family protein [Acinetobacter nectaris]MCF9028060.1 patatin-like phospholipase family protein [Acinetobacter nectaris]
MKKWAFILISFLFLPLVAVAQQSTILVHVEHGQIIETAEARPSAYNFHVEKEKKHKPIIALVLGSGGARGYAHIGAIEALESQGIRPDFIVGTSAGSIVGAMYASGKTADEMKNIALNMKVNDVREITLTRKGFLDGEKVSDFVNKQIDYLPLEKMKIPLYIVATELKTGAKTVFDYGNTGQAVQASTAIPSMFIPAKIAGKEYVDGGLVSPVPVEVARHLGADIVIAVDILQQPQYTETTNMWGLFNQNINIMQQHLSQNELKNADIVIQPDIREKAHIFDVKARDNTMSAGLIAAQNKIDQLKEIIHQKSLLMQEKNTEMF